MEDEKKLVKASFKERWEALKLAVSWTYKSSKFLTFIIFFTAIVGGLLVIVEPYVFKLIIDSITKSSELNLASKFGLGIVGILIVYGIARVLKGLLWDIQTTIKKIHTQRLDRYATQEMMSKISSLDVVYFEDPEYYNTLTKANTNLWRVNEFLWECTFLLTQLISLLVIVGALLSFDWRIVVLILVGAIPGIILSMKSARITWGIFDSASPISRQAYYYKSLMTDSPQAVKEIKLFGLQSHFLKRFDYLIGKYMKKQEKSALLESLFMIGIGFIEAFLSIIATWFVVKGYLDGRIGIGDVAFFWALLFQFADHARWVVRLIGSMNISATFVTYLLRILNFKPQIVEIKNPKIFPNKLEKGIEFRNVSFKYPKAKNWSLRNVNFFIKPGESVALVGENGSGKTTLIKLLCRLYDVSEGEILIDGININEYSLDELYENLGVIFQDFMRYEALVGENIGFGRVNVKEKEKIHRASVKAEAWDFIKDLEDKYKTQLGKTLKEKGVELSVGQWQKIALGRAFFRDAQILILDEPTAAVDAKAEYRLFQKLKHLTKKKTTFLISHRFSTVRMAHKIIVVDKGKVIEMGSHRELLNRNGEYAKMFRLQAEGYK